MAAARPLPVPSSAAPPPVTIATFPLRPHSLLGVIACPRYHMLAHISLAQVSVTGGSGVGVGVFWKSQGSPSRKLSSCGMIFSFSWLEPSDRFYREARLSGSCRQTTQTDRFIELTDRLVSAVETSGRCTGHVPARRCLFSRREEAQLRLLRPPNPQDRYPLLLFYHPLNIYRKQVIPLVTHLCRRASKQLLLHRPVIWKKPSATGWQHC
jgi:hypothetical protein